MNDAMTIAHHIASTTPPRGLIRTRHARLEAFAALALAYLGGFTVAALLAWNVLAALCVTFDLTMPTAAELAAYWF